MAAATVSKTQELHITSSAASYYHNVKNGNIVGENEGRNISHEYREKLHPYSYDSIRR
jgi:hypothetical protein